MKKSILLLFLLIVQFSFAQQEEYTEFLTNAKTSVKSGNFKDFKTNFRYFVTALDRDEIKPEELTEENFELFSYCIWWGVSSQFITAEDLKIDVVQFLEYDIENHPVNMGVLGTMYLTNLGGQQDFEKARHWFEKGAEKNDVWSIQQLGSMYSSGIFGVKQDFKKAQIYYQKAADLGSALAYAMLASYYMYGEGFGLKKDLDKALLSYEKAIELANEYEKASFMQQLGIFYQFAENDQKKADEWHKKAIAHHLQRAEKGDAMAMWSLGSIYQFGNGAPIDLVKAKNWYQKACEAELEFGCQSLETLK